LQTAACIAATLLFATNFAFAVPTPHDKTAFVKAIRFKNGVIDKDHRYSWNGGTIAFGSAVPSGTYPSWGIEIHGLACNPDPTEKIPSMLLVGGDAGIREPRLFLRNRPRGRSRGLLAERNRLSDRSRMAPDEAVICH
jgi:hypothetical protein